MEDERIKSMLFRFGMTLLFFTMIYSLQREKQSIVQVFNKKYEAYLIRLPDRCVIIVTTRPYKHLRCKEILLLDKVPYTLKKESFTKIDRI